MRHKNLVSELSEEQLDELLAYTPEFSQRNLENIKRLSLEKANEKQLPIRRKMSIKKLSTIAAAVLLLITSTAVFAATGGFAYFLAPFNQNFGEFAIAPLYPAYAESQEIRIEAVGAQQIGNVVLAYVSMHDLSGENRLTRYMSPDLAIYVDGQRMDGPSTWQINFNENTNTVYFEMRLVGEVGMPRAETIELKTTSIVCRENWGQVQRVFEGEWYMTVNTSDLGIQPIVWTDIQSGNLHIEYLSLSPLGLQIAGSHSYGSDFPRGMNSPFQDIRIGFENRWFNTRLRGGGGGIGHDTFSIFIFADSPIEIEYVSAVIFNGERIQVP